MYKVGMQGIYKACIQGLYTRLVYKACIQGLSTLQGLKMQSSLPTAHSCGSVDYNDKRWHGC